MEITTRKDAISAGKKYFFTGKPCKHGHLAERYVGNGGCVDCLHPKPTAMVLSKPAEILAPESVQETQLAVIQRRQQIMELKFRDIQSRIQLRESRIRTMETSMELRIEARKERQQAQARKSLIRSRMVELPLPVDLSDYDHLLSIAWAMAVARERTFQREDVATGKKQTLRKEDLVTGKILKDFREAHIFRCFPEDKEELVKIADMLYRDHLSAFPTPEETSKRAEALLAEENKEGREPEWSEKWN